MNVELLDIASFEKIPIISIEDGGQSEVYDIEIDTVHAFNAKNIENGMESVSHNSAMLSLFNLDDEDMLTCKFGKWYETAPYRARANNSAVILRHKIEKDVFLELWEKIKNSGSGEPGFFFTNNAEWLLNPCGEVSLRANQMCNLTTINATNVVDQEDLNNRARMAARIATLQASYTNFHYLREEWEKTTEKEALIGVSMTGIATGHVLKLDLEAAAIIVKEENEKIAKLIGINKAARCTVLKPEGTSSLIVGSSSGIHAWHSKYYVRRIRVGKNEAIYDYLHINHPELIEDEYFKPQTQAVIMVPQKAPDDAITRDESALDLLKRVTDVYKRWIVPGHRKGDNHNNVSCTVTIKPDEWDAVGEWMWKHKDEYTALSVLPADEHSYIQPPFTDMTKTDYEKQIKHLHEVDLTKVLETEDGTSLQENLACAGGKCDIV